MHCNTFNQILRYFCISNSCSKAQRSYLGILFFSFSPPKKGQGQKHLKQGSAPMPVWASFGGRQSALLGGYETLPGSTASPQHRQNSLDTNLQTLMGSPRDNTPNSGDAARPQLEVSFTNLSLRLKGTGRRVVAGVTGQLRAAHLTAIMGPSVAGKLWLIHQLSHIHVRHYSLTRTKDRRPCATQQGCMVSL